MKRITVTIVLMGLLLLIAACGGGGGTSMAVYVPTKATVKLSSAGTGTTIYGIDMTINLPAGVSVRSSATGTTEAGVITASGGAATGSLVTGIYTAPTGTFPATLQVLLANAGGFPVGEFCTVNADVAPGASSDFSIESFSARDGDGAAIPGLTGDVSAAIL